MTLSEIKKNYVFSTRIEFGEDFIELREPTQQENLNLSDDAKKNLEEYAKLLPKCIVASSITKEDGKQASNQEIADALSQSGTLYTDILTQWLNALPFQSRTKRNQN